MQTAQRQGMKHATLGLEEPLGRSGFDPGFREWEHGDFYMRILCVSMGFTVGLMVILWWFNGVSMGFNGI